MESRVVFLGSFPSPTTRTTMSRSVKMPHTLPSLRTTTSPTSYSRMARAASVTEEEPFKTIGVEVITSRTCILLGLRLDDTRDLAAVSSDRLGEAWHVVCTRVPRTGSDVPPAREISSPLNCFQ